MEDFKEKNNSALGEVARDVMGDRQAELDLEDKAVQERMREIESFIAKPGYTTGEALALTSEFRALSDKRLDLFNQISNINTLSKAYDAQKNNKDLIQNETKAVEASFQSGLEDMNKVKQELGEDSAEYRDARIKFAGIAEEYDKGKKMADKPAPEILVSEQKSGVEIATKTVKEKVKTVDILRIVSDLPEASPELVDVLKVGEKIKEFKNKTEGVTGSLINKIAGTMFEDSFSQATSDYENLKKTVQEKFGDNADEIVSEAISLIEKQVLKWMIYQQVEGGEKNRKIPEKYLPLLQEFNDLSKKTIDGNDTRVQEIIATTAV